MGRKKLTMKKIESPNSRQVTYSKGKDRIVKKANELAVLCDTDVALLMFSPTGRLTSFASKGRVEDILLRFVDRPDELRVGPILHKEDLSQRLKQLKCEGELLEKIATIEALEEKLYKLNRRRREAKEKMRYYNPNVEKINSVLEVGAYQQFLTRAIQRIELSKAKLLGKKIPPQNPESFEVAAVDMADVTSINAESAGSNKERNLSMDGHNPEEICLPTGPHLSLSFILSQEKWNLARCEQDPY